MKEIWKDIEGYEGLYQVSNLGRVKRLKGKYMSKERILKPCENNTGYLQVHLCKNSKSKFYKVHRLVALAFIQNPENKQQVNHIDETKLNNVVSNLEWVTAKENNNHGTRIERSIISNQKKVKAIDIANGEYNYYESLKACGMELGIEPSSITKQLKGKLKQTGGYVFEYTK